jgi:poly-gamma-glutamate system protein
LKLGLGRERVYYRPAGPKPLELLVLAVFGVGLLVLSEHVHFGPKNPKTELALAAAERAERAFEAIRKERLARHIPLLPEFDPAGTGLIFGKDTSISTSSGSLSAKQTSANPNFAALVVQFFDELEIKPGEPIAVGYTGSFPALNIALLAASAELGLKLVIVASAASSDYGASDLRFSWLDMEGVLQSQAIVPYRALAASLGGLEDRGVGLRDDAKKGLEAAILRSGAKPLLAESYEDSLRERIAFFEKESRGEPYRAYVNIGGGAVSLGRSRSQTTLGPGVHEPTSSFPSPPRDQDSIAGYFLSRGVPVLHLGQVVELARHYGLPVSPKKRPRPGTGQIFSPGAPSPGLSLAALLAFVAALSWVGARARRRAPLGPLPSEILLESAPSRHARPASLGPDNPSIAPHPEEATLPSLVPGRDSSERGD